MIDFVGGELVVEGYEYCFELCCGVDELDVVDVGG